MTSARFPLLPTIRLRIGVSGHRGPPKLPEESEAPIRTLIDRVLATVVATTRKAESDLDGILPRRGRAAAALSPAADVARQFVIVSSVAEGADRIVAEAGLAAGFGLELVLPFARAEYARDFETESSKAQYRDLLTRAAAVFELNGTDPERARSYEAAGVVMLANIDVLIAIWDGAEAAGIGGTAQIVAGAVDSGIPVVWIDPAKPDAMQLAWPEAGEVPPASARPEESFRACDEERLAKTVAEIQAPPKRPQALQALRLYLGERERRWNFCPWYSLLLRLYGVKDLTWSDFRLPPALAAARAEWEGYLTRLPADRSQRPAIESILLPAFAAADRSAIYYSYVYRSGYIFNFALAALAIALALGGIRTQSPAVKSTLVAIELATIVIMLATWWYGRHRQWHRRWIAYRRLAECVRHLRLFAPIGTQGAADRTRRSLDGDGDDWVDWYAWSLRRLLPLPDRAVDGVYLDKMRDAVRAAEIANQIAYHTTNADRMRKLDRRLHRSGMTLFLSAGGLCVGFLGMALLGMLDQAAAAFGSIGLVVFTFVTALFPALGAALTGIQVQGDFAASAEQSERTKRRLAAIDAMLENEEPVFARLADRVEKTSDVLMSDVIEWQTVFRTRRLCPPA